MIVLPSFVIPISRTPQHTALIPTGRRRGSAIFVRVLDLLKSERHFLHLASAIAVKRSYRRNRRVRQTNGLIDLGVRADFSFEFEHDGCQRLAAGGSFDKK